MYVCDQQLINDYQLVLSGNHGSTASMVENDNNNDNKLLKSSLN